jgi:hypothetical protein
MDEVRIMDHLLPGIAISNKPVTDVVDRSTDPTNKSNTRLR